MPTIAVKAHKTGVVAFLVLAAFVLATGATRAASSCNDIAVEYSQCMAAGDRAYSNAATESGDFSYVEKCAQQRDQDSTRLCRGAGAQASERQAESAAISQSREANRTQMAEDHVTAFKNARCTLSRDTSGSPLMDGNGGRMNCPENPGAWANCVRIGSRSSFSCAADSAELALLAPNEFTVSGLVLEQLPGISVPSDCLKTGMKAVGAGIRAGSSGKVVSILMADAGGRPAYATIRLQGEASASSQVQQFLVNSCRSSLEREKNMQGSALQYYLGFVEWLTGEKNQAKITEPSAAEKKYLRKGFMGIRG